MDEERLIYEDGFPRLLKKLEKRQRRFDGVDELFLKNVDLPMLFKEIVEVPTVPLKPIEEHTLDTKWLELQHEFKAKPKILMVHAMLVSILRRHSPPEHIVNLFHRIWAEHGREMVPLLDVRWMISTATTFADTGKTADLRAAGMGLSIMFDMIKLHDSERRLSGRAGRNPFRPKSGKRFPLAFNMDPYSFKKGDLDRHMLARLWVLCENAPEIRPLGFAMLRMVMSDPRSIFGRVQELKAIVKSHPDLL